MFHSSPLEPYGEPMLLAVFPTVSRAPTRGAAGVVVADPVLALEVIDPDRLRVHPAEETLMIGAGALRSISGISRFVSRKKPITLVASVCSFPWGESPRFWVSTPALLTSTSRGAPAR
jgi:hypothetical protein